MPLHHPGLTPEPQAPDPRSFFVELLPKLLQHRTSGGESIGFILDGGEGGSWTIDLARGEVLDGAADAPCSMSLASEDFARMMNGKLDVVGALQSGEIRISGTRIASALRALMNVLP